MDSPRTIGQRAFGAVEFLNSASLTLVSAGVAAFALSGLARIVLVVCAASLFEPMHDPLPSPLQSLGFFWALWRACLVLGTLQAVFSAFSLFKRRGQGLAKRSVHLLAVAAWPIALGVLYILPALPTMANKIRQRDTRYLAEHFRQHRADFESLREELLRTKRASKWEGQNGATGWDGMFECYKDGRVDIEVFQEPQGLNGQIFVGYTKKGSRPLDGTVVKDLQKDFGRTYEVYQPLGDDWYIYYWSS